MDGAGKQESDYRDEQLGRLVDEFFVRQQRGESITETEFLNQHRDMPDELRHLLEAARGLVRPADELATLVSRGMLTAPTDAKQYPMFGVHEIRAVAGHGGMGIVLDAWDTRLHRRVALKLLHPDLARDPVAVARFNREARAAAGIQHPNIVGVYGVGHDDGNHYIEMEFVDGPNLSTVLRHHGPLPEPVIRRIIREVLQGLGTAHAHHLLHRDIKPSNVILAGCHKWLDGSGVEQEPTDGTPRVQAILPEDLPPDPFVKISDFGLARLESSQTQLTMAHSVLGTPEYMSPEQARGASNIDVRSDLYAVGVVLYEMLTGSTPFKADTPTATLRRVLDDVPNHPRSLCDRADPVLSSIALRLLAKKPADRLATTDAVMKALDSNRRIWSGPQAILPGRRVIGTGLVVALLAAVTWGWAVGLRTGQPPQLTPAITYDTEAEAGDPLGRRRVMVDPTGQGDELYIRAIPQDNGQSDVLVARLPNDRIVWQASLEPDQPVPWPDVPPEESRQECVNIIGGNLDGQPGDEVVVVAHGGYHPTQITLIDPRNATVRQRFWNTGHIRHVFVLPDFFGPQRPAVIAWGLNNKLGGYEAAADICDAPRTSAYDVCCVVILDPTNMGGLSPPFRDRLGTIPVAHPHCYAFLDEPAYSTPPDRPHGGPLLDFQSTDTRLCAVAGTAEYPDGPHFEWRIRRVRGEGLSAEFYGGVQFALNRDLAVLAKGTTVLPGERETADAWAARWRVIVLNGAPRD
ncbi:MAG: serine/threonine protein kinase [Phycisphaerae bacterium]|nr:serine/threonine protein kinase [Phycisphaerae bacterium]